ncbi:hypothetical protein WR25_02486 [Diploscapter pachys]|uniref:Transthyretin-like family protein n=1 Tax=Diploscapter pachys TaxID=2018661 RepID=A0A2A2KNA6_9BILA|nr:hypothetical protein WR25_02486 [Diploscapter pachys]
MCIETGQFEKLLLAKLFVFLFFHNLPFLPILILAIIGFENRSFSKKYTAFTRAVAVKGILMCGDRPAGGVKVKIFDEDSGPDPDDVLDEGYTNPDGSFFLKGSERELTNIDPKFKIYHDCDDGIKPGQRKVKITVPDSYISSGGIAKRVFDIGVINLEGKYHNEERDLF